MTDPAAFPLVPRRAPIRLLPWLLALAAAMLAALPWLPAPPESASTPAAAPAATMVQGISLPPLATLTETLQRPIFEPLRRPPPDRAVAVAPSGPTVIGRYRLLGIVTAGGQRQAALGRIEGGGSFLVGAGAALDDWRVIAVEEEAITVGRGEERQTVRLRKAAETAPARR